MAGKGSSRQRKSSFSLFSMFKSRKAAPNDPWEEGAWAARKAYPSDEDRRYCWVAEPGIDHRASAFIARFHEARLSEVQTMSINPTN